MRLHGRVWVLLSLSRRGPSAHGNGNFRPAAFRGPRDGRSRTASYRHESHGRFIYDDAGEPRWLVGTSADATERMRREGLRGRQDAMFSSIDAGVWYSDLPFDVLTWDRKIKEHFWFPPDARVTIEAFYDRLHSDDRERTRAASAESIAAHAP